MHYKISFSKAINDALCLSMEKDKNVCVIGQLVDYKSGIFGTTTGLLNKFGKNRVVDFPIAESLMTSHAIGLSLSGLKPVLVHQRLDFAMYSLDSIINWISLWRFKSAKTSNISLVIRVIVGKGWGQGPQHSKSLYSLFSHLPGLKVYVPSNPSDAKGMLINAIFDNSPSIFFENRALFGIEDIVNKNFYKIQPGKCRKIFNGKRLTIVSFGNELQICKRVVINSKFQKLVDLIDLRTTKPLDIETIKKSVKKTKKLLVIEGDWKSFGVSSEIISRISEDKNIKLKINPVRLCYPDSHTPASSYLENIFYIDEKKIYQIIKNMLK